MQSEGGGGLGDSMGLAKEPRLTTLLPSGEKIISSCEIQKFNEANKCQMRIFMVTNAAVYNIQRNQNFIKSMMSKIVSFQNKFTIRRRIPLEQIEAITISNLDKNDEFILHVVKEHDYRFRMQDYATKISLIKCICLQYERKIKKKMAFYFKNDLSLIDYCTFKGDLKEKKNKKPKENPTYLNLQDLIEYELPGVQFKPVYWKGDKSVPINSFKSSSIEKMKQGREYFAIQTKSIKYHDIIKKFENSHPFIFLPNYCFETSDNLYLLWPLSLGGRLHKIIERVGALKQELCKFYVAQLILILDYLHKMGWVYRNLSLEDIFMKQNGYIWLDGLGKFMRNQKKNVLFHDICGRSLNFPPQMILMQGHDEKVDIWGLGICTFWMINGHHPFENLSIKIAFEKILHGKIEATFEVMPSFLRRSFAVNPKQRISLQQIKKDEWFKEIDWEKLEKEEIPAPYLPDIDSVHLWEGKLPQIVYIQPN